MWLRIVWARRSASTSAVTVSPTRSRPWSVPRWTIEAAERPLGVGDREQLAAAAGLAQDAEIADLAAALGVERRPVEDDLGLAVAGQLVELQPVADDRRRPGPRPSSSRSRGTRCRRPAPGSAPYSEASSACLGELGLRPGSAPVALLRQGGVEPARSTPTPYSAASSIVRSIGKP